MSYSIAQGIAQFGQSIGMGLRDMQKNKQRREFVQGRIESLNEEKEQDYFEQVEMFKAGKITEEQLKVSADDLQSWHKMADPSQATGKLEGVLAEFEANEEREMNELRKELVQNQIIGQQNKQAIDNYNFKIQKRQNRIDRQNAKSAAALSKEVANTSQSTVTDFTEETLPAEFETRYPVNKTKEQLERERRDKVEEKRETGSAYSSEEAGVFNKTDFGSAEIYSQNAIFDVPSTVDISTKGGAFNIGKVPTGLAGEMAEGAVNAVTAPFRDRGPLNESYNWSVFPVTNEELLPYLKTYKGENPEATKLYSYQNNMPKHIRNVDEGKIKLEDLDSFIKYANAERDLKSVRTENKSRAQITKTDKGELLPPLPPGFEYGRERVKTKDAETIRTPFERKRTDDEVRDELSNLMQSEEAQKMTPEARLKLKETLESTTFGDIRVQDVDGTRVMTNIKSGRTDILPSKEEQVDLEKVTQQMIKAGMVPEEYLVKVGGTTMKFVPKGAGAGKVKRSESEAKSYVFSSRMVANEYRLEQIQNKADFDAASFGMYIQQLKNDKGEKVPLANYPEIARTQSAKEYISAVDNWIEAALRKVSGAAIAAHEYSNYRTMFFPLVNDSAETIEYKRRLRNIYARSFMESANIPDIEGQRNNWLEQIRGNQTVWGENAEEAIPRFNTEAEAEAAGLRPGQQVYIRKGATYDLGTYKAPVMSEQDNAIKAKLQKAIEMGDREEVIRVLQKVEM